MMVCLCDFNSNKNVRGKADDPLDGLYKQLLTVQMKRKTH